jgi:predicted dehydrogenase
MARVHLGYILENVPKENIAVCDLDEIGAEAFAEEFQIPEYFDDLNKMLADFKPNICHIITPPHTHAQVAIKCMEQGSHVFIEKPMCTTLKDADEIVYISNKTKKLVCVGHQRLFEKQVVEAKRLIESGQFGNVLHVYTADCNNY